MSPTKQQLKGSLEYIAKINLGNMRKSEIVTEIKSSLLEQ